jgi:hypothetical protein
VFDNKNEVLSERLLIARAPATPIHVKAERTTVHPRESISVAVEAPGLGGIPLTVSVYAEDLFSPKIGLHHAFMPIARLPLGALGFRIDSSWTLRAWNAFLTTQRWKRFNWADVWNGRTEREHPFVKYLKFKGKVVVPDHSAKFDSVRVTFFLRNEVRVYEQYTNRMGEFELDLFFDFDDEEEVIYAVDRKGIIWEGASVVLDPEGVPSFTLPANGRAVGMDRYASFAALRQSVSAAFKRYDGAGDIGMATRGNADVEDELFEADVTVRLDDYLTFPDMEETLREIVPKLQHRWRGKHHTVKVALSEPDMLAVADPMYFIDGVLTDDTDYFMELNPKDIVTIQIVSLQQKLRTMGIMGRNGVVLVTTKRHDLQVPKTRNSFTATGISRPIEFNNTSESKSASASERTPMLRSTAYLNPLLSLNATGAGKFEFVVPDNLGRICVEVTALSENGTLYRAVTYLRSLAPTSVP